MNWNRSRKAAPISPLERANQEWSMEFVMDGLATGRTLRILTIVDSYTRACLAIEVDSCLSSRRVTRALEWIIEQRGEPETLRCDNGRKFPSQRLGIQVGLHRFRAGFPHAGGVLPRLLHWAEYRIAHSARSLFAGRARVNIGKSVGSNLNAWLYLSLTPHRPAPLELGRMPRNELSLV